MNTITRYLHDIWISFLRYIGKLPPDPHKIGPDVIIENPTHAPVTLSTPLLFNHQPFTIQPGKSLQICSPVVEYSYVAKSMTVRRWDALYVVKDAIKQFEDSRGLGEWDPRNPKPWKPLLSGLKVYRVKK